MSAYVCVSCFMMKANTLVGVRYRIGCVAEATEARALRPHHNWICESIQFRGLLRASLFSAYIGKVTYRP